MAKRRHPKPRLHRAGQKVDAASDYQARTFNYDNVPIMVVVPEDQFIDYADAFTISHSHEEFVVSFLQLQYPIVTSREQLDAVNSIDSVCVARVALTPRRLIALIDALQENFAGFMAEQEVFKAEQEAAKDVPQPGDTSTEAGGRSPE